MSIEAKDGPTWIRRSWSRLVKTRVRTFVIGSVVGYALAALMGLGPEQMVRTEARKLCMQRIAQQLSVVTPDMLVKLCR